MAIVPDPVLGVTLTDTFDEPAPVSVADLLTQSRAAHLAKRTSVGRTDRAGLITEQPNYPKAEQHIADALRLRLDAEALDPMFLDPAWAEDNRLNKGVSHQALVVFFRKYPTIP